MPTIPSGLPGMGPADLWVVIPVGGEAKRLKPLTSEVSKAVVRIFNRPIVEFAIAELALQGVKNFIFGVRGYVNYKSLIDYFKDGTGFSARYGISPRVHIKYQPNVDDVGSADSVRINMEYYDIRTPLLVVQGDNLFDIDLKGLLAFHEEKKSLMTVVLTYVEDVEHYGIADVGRDGRVRGFIEKPRKEEAPSRLANTGIYLLSPEVREVFCHTRVQEMIRERGRLDFGLDLIPFLVDSGNPVYGYVLRGEWYDVGTPKGYLDTMLRVLKSSGSSLLYFGEPVHGLGRVWIQGESPESLAKKEEIVKKVRDGRVRLQGSVVIGRHCEIGDGTIIRDSCIDNFCIVGADVTIDRAALMDRVVVGDGAEVQDSILGRHSRVKSSRDRSTWIIGMSVLGDDVTVGVGSFMTSAKVPPHRVIEDGSRIVAQTLD